MEKKRGGGIELIGLDKEESLGFIDLTIRQQEISDARSKFEGLMAKADRTKGKRKDAFLRSASQLLKKYPELFQNSTPES